MKGQSSGGEAAFKHGLTLPHVTEYFSKAEFYPAILAAVRRTICVILADSACSDAMLDYHFQDLVGGF